jgi:hypothetical protein
MHVFAQGAVVRQELGDAVGGFGHAILASALKPSSLPRLRFRFAAKPHKLMRSAMQRAHAGTVAAVHGQ